VGRAVAFICALVLVGCGMSKADGRSTANGGGPPNAGLEERPSEYRRWAVLGSDILHFDEVLAAEVIPLDPNRLVGIPSISPGAAKVAYPVGSGDDAGVVLVDTSDFGTPIFEWKVAASSPSLSWIGGQSVLVTSVQNDRPFGHLLALGHPLPSELGLGGILAQSSNGAIFDAVEGLSYLGTGEEPRFIADVEPGGAAVSEDGSRIALVATGALGLGSDPLPITSTGVSVDIVDWVPPPPPNCPHPDAPSCELPPGHISLRRAAYAPDNSLFFLEESTEAGVHLNYTTLTPPVVIPMNSGETVAYGIGDPAWGFLRDGRYYYATNTHAADVKDDTHRLVVRGVTGARMPGAAQQAVPSGDQTWMFVSVWRRDDLDGVGEHAVEATRLADSSDVLPAELFTTAVTDMFIVPSPVGADLLVGAQNYDKKTGSYCSTTPRTDCDGISYYLVRDARPGAVPLRGIQGPLWTPDGQGLLAERNQKIVYLPRDAPDQVYELADGYRTALRMPSWWQQSDKPE